MSTTRINDDDLASVALYDKVNAIANEFDAETVKLTGDQTIEDVKTFTDEIYAPNQLDYSRITNCITHIPQDIKLELNNGTLTLKAGSKVYVPNGAGKFDEVVIASDLSTSGTSYSNPCFIIYDHVGKHISVRDIQQCQSGTSTPTSAISGVYIYYNTSENKVYSYTNNVWTVRTLALPLCIVNMQNTTPYITSIDQVFNGFGYIGSTTFVLPGVKGLIPNGRNADGSLRNIEYSNTILRTRIFNWDISGLGQFFAISTTGLASSGTNVPFYQQEETPPNRTYAYWYKPSENIMYSTGSGTTWYKTDLMVVGQIVGDNTGRITSFTHKIPFRAVDYNDFAPVKDVIPTKQDIATAVNYDNITNCITDIPQDIKLELNNGTLTLKAGSKVYVPNGVGVFNAVTLTNDISSSSSWTTNKVILALNQNYNGMYSFVLENQYSSATEPSNPNDGTIWYDTTNNLIKRYNGTSWVSGVSFPICIANMVSGTGFSSIDKVFNSFGYIGKRNFITNVKLLIAKGYNANGTYHNQEYTINTPIVSKNDFGNNSIMFIRYNRGSYQIYNIGKQNYLGELDYVPKVGQGFQWYYNTTERLWYMHEAGETSWRQVDYANLGVNTSTETNFKEVFRAVDYNDFAQHVVVSTLPANLSSNTFYYIPE